MNRAERRALGRRRPSERAVDGDRVSRLSFWVLLVEGVLGLLGGLRFLQQATRMTYVPLADVTVLLAVLAMVPGIVALVACWRFRHSRDRGRRVGLVAAWMFAVVAGLWTLVSIASPDAFALLLGLLVLGPNVLVVRDLRRT